MSTKIFAAYNAYLTIIQTALPAITIYDGPQPTLPTDLDFVVVGSDDVLGEGMVVAVDAGNQDWADLGAYQRDETFVIMSTYVAWTGDNDLPGCRARAAASVAAIESALRRPPAGTGDGMLNGTLNTIVGWCGLAITRLEQIQDPQGAALHVQFALACRARI